VAAATKDDAVILVDDGVGKRSRDQRAKL